MSLLSVERDTEILIDNQLRNLGWRNDPKSAIRNVYQQRVKTQLQRKRLRGLRPDYILYPSNSSVPLAVIEAKRKGRNIHDALRQGAEYADRLDAPLVFATDGVFTKTIHARVNKPLMLNGEELDALIRESLAVKYIGTNEVSTLGKRVVQSGSELISIFSTVNNLLREEGLQKGLERFTEFSNILFLKVLSEIEDGKEEIGARSFIDQAYRWNYFRNKKGPELLSYVSDTVLKWFSREYQDDNIFQPLQIQRTRHPSGNVGSGRGRDALRLADGHHLPAGQRRDRPRLRDAGGLRRSLGAGSAHRRARRTGGGLHDPGRFRERGPSARTPLHGNLGRVGRRSRCRCPAS